MVCIIGYSLFEQTRSYPPLVLCAFWGVRSDVINRDIWRNCDGINLNGTCISGTRSSLYFFQTFMLDVGAHNEIKEGNFWECRQLLLKCLILYGNPMV